MLNQNRVLNYIKDGIVFGFMQIELTDAQIIEYFTNYSLRTFSQYFPDVNKMNLNPLLESNQVPGRQNEYYINDSEGLEILNVKNVYFDQSDLYINGHPPLGPFGVGEIEEWSLSVFNYGMIKQFGNYDRTIEFRHPNILRISPVPNNVGSMTVEYERFHNVDLSTIPNEFQMLFCELAKADIMIVIGNIRKKYGGNLRTPFGEINLSAELYDEGKELRRELVDKFVAGSHFNLDIAVG